MAIGNTLRAILGLDNKQFNKGLKEAEGKVKGFSNSLKNLAATVGVAFGLGQLVKFGSEVVKLGAKAEGVRIAFDKLNSPALLNNLRSATRNTVADIDLMSAAVRANNFRISLEALPRYFEFAQQRARATGESVDYLVESIVMGIGRKSAMILDNLGISLTEINEELKLTPDYAKAVGNIMEREMAKAGDATETAADNIEQLRTAWKNMMTELGEGKAAGFVTRVMGNIAEEMRIRNDPNLTRKQKGEFIFPRGSGAYDKYLAQQAEYAGATGYNPAANLAAQLGIGTGFNMTAGLAQSPAAPVEEVTDAVDEADEAIKRTIMDAEQLWNSLVMPAQAGQQMGGTFGALEGSFADPTQLAAVSEQLVVQNDYLYEQLAIVQQLQGTFEGLFAAGLQGWDAFKEAAVDAILQMIVKLAALGATYAALAMIPGFAGFMEFVGAISNPMGVASKLNAGAGAGVGSAVDAIGGLNLRTEVSGSNLAVIVSRGGSQMGSDT